MSVNALPRLATGHWLDKLPYAALVYIKTNPHGVALYQVAGSATAACSAEKALRAAHALHGGTCFYCEKKAEPLTIDHVEATYLGGSDSLTNLVIACQKCNRDKNNKPIEVFNPKAGRDWLEAVRELIEARLAKL